MIDQGFSAENLRRIWDLRTRRGEDLSGFFSEIESITSRLKTLGAERHAALKAIAAGTPEYQLASDHHAELRARAQEIKEARLRSRLDQLSVAINARIDANNFHWNITPGTEARRKQTYRIDRTNSEMYFVSRQIELNLRRSFDLRPPNRDIAARQLLLCLDDDIEKIAVRTDIRHFYESIPHDKLKEHLRKSARLSRTSYRFISSLLDEYSEITGTPLGVPRGLAISSALAEVYLTQLDDRLNRLPDTLLYLRYVDDIVLIFAGGRHHPAKDARRQVVRAAVASLGLSLNPQKTRYYLVPLAPPTKDQTLTFLGYAYRLTGSGVQVDISAKRARRYRRRLELSFANYLSGPPGGSPERSLVDRVRFLTGNTRLSNNKRQALVGIYFSNSLLKRATGRILELDARLVVLRTTVPLSDRGIALLAESSFARGYETPVYYSFSPKHLQRIVKIWKNDEEA